MISIVYWTIMEWIIERLVFVGKSIEMVNSYKVKEYNNFKW